MNDALTGLKGKGPLCSDTTSEWLPWLVCFSETIPFALGNTSLPRSRAGTHALPAGRGTRVRRMRLWRRNFCPLIREFFSDLDGPVVQWNSRQLYVLKCMQSGHVSFPASPVKGSQVEVDVMKDSSLMRSWRAATDQTRQDSPTWP